ncbi:rod-binding protein [Pseudoalteromonas shioyasakiensis]|uniref:rod-binding protein n=1 Tax=Pseudoalteromonas shioyasakiensis TaxID=1190813 RepID=UPI002118B394|nr:rod-binding protein [Pseudoalteromonas shioyasakiensis]MCQ8877511.1 rod-binding protein [Pseudoalteromonas shioyasakiensis]
MKIDSRDIHQSLAIDPQQLEKITANMSEKAGLKQAAEQFEAVFLQLVLKNMHAATEEMSSENGFFSSKEQAQFRDMYDAQTAQHLATTNQLGLAEAIIRQFDEQISTVENKFKEMAEVVAEANQDKEKKVENMQENDFYSSSAFTQPLNIIPIR